MNARRTIFEIYLDYVQYYGGSIRLRSLLALGGELGLTTTAMRAALCRLCSQGWLQASTWEKQRFYALTAMGRQRVEEAAPRIFAPEVEQWDGQWTILTYSLPERLRSQRDRLRRELTWLGYGLLLPSVWISPRPIVDVTRQHLRQRKLDGFVQLFRARHVTSAVQDDIVSRCWDLKHAQKCYAQFTRRWEPEWRKLQASLSNGHGSAESICFASNMQLLHDYGKFLHIDPRLPSELLPAHWPGKNAFRLFRECHLLLAEKALNFFERHFHGPPQTRRQQLAGRQKALHQLYRVE
jgi:phenylacetic acid degradation operon negative regulatory protein